MDQLISRLIEVDKEARARVAAAKKQRAKALETVDEKRRELDENNQQALEALIQKEQTAAENAKAAALTEIEQKKDALLSRLDAIYAENKDAWVTSIVENVLND